MAIKTDLAAEERAFYRRHRRELRERYGNRCVLIRGQEVVALYANEIAAIRAVWADGTPGVTLVQRLDRGPWTYTIVCRQSGEDEPG